MPGGKSLRKAKRNFFSTRCSKGFSMGHDHTFFSRFVQSSMLSSWARMFSGRAGISMPRFLLSFLRLWAKPLWIVVMNFSRSWSWIRGLGKRSICRIAELTFGEGRKCEGGTFAMIFGVPKIWTSRARTDKSPGLAQIFLATSC